MQLSKLTFSLASLVVLFAFLVTPTMAHDTDAGTEGIQHGTVTLTAADHTATPHKPSPMVSSVALADIEAREVGATTGSAKSSTVSGSNVLLVDLTDAADPIKIALDGTAGGTFRVEITFSEAVYDTLAGGTPADADLAIGDLTVTAASRSASGTDIFGAATDGTDITAAVARKVTGVDASNNNILSPDTFVVTFTVPQGVIQTTQTPTPADAANPTPAELQAIADAEATNKLPIDVWVTVPENVVSSATGLVGGTETAGVGNAASMRDVHDRC